MAGAAELEVGEAFGELVAVEQQLHIAAIARHPAKLFMLAAFAVFAKVGKGTIRRGHAGIVFLDAAAHFRNQLLLQSGGVAEQALGIGILRFEIFSDIWIQHRRVVQHLLPVGVLQPGVIVGYGDAVSVKGMWPARRHRRQSLFLQRFCHGSPRGRGEYQLPSYGAGRADLP